jgi:hypothetical protein
MFCLLGFPSITVAFIDQVVTLKADTDTSRHTEGRLLNCLGSRYPEKRIDWRYYNGT